jgi:hypothetical protein
MGVAVSRAEKEEEEREVEMRLPFIAERHQG